MPEQRGAVPPAESSVSTHRADGLAGSGERRRPVGSGGGRPMAIMIPDSCPARATVGEKRTYGLLQDLLPDDFTVWYEPVVQGRYPDFTLLAGGFGLLVLEAKGWYPKQLVKVSDQDVELLRTVDGQEHVERHKNPIRQVREYLFGLMDELGRL